MAVLDVYLKNEHIEQVELTSTSLTIGRKQDNGLILHDLTVSRNHARMTFTSEINFWRIENLSATNPVKLNGDPLTKPEILFHDDHIFIGTYTLVFRETGHAEPAKTSVRAAKKQVDADKATVAEPQPERTKVVSDE